MPSGAISTLRILVSFAEVSSNGTSPLKCPPVVAESCCFSRILLFQQHQVTRASFKTLMVTCSFDSYTVTAVAG